MKFYITTFDSVHPHNEIFVIGNYLSEVPGFSICNSIEEADFIWATGPAYIDFVLSEKTANDVIRLNKPIIFVFFGDSSCHDNIIAEISIPSFKKLFDSEFHALTKIVFWKDFYCRYDLPTVLHPNKISFEFMYRQLWYRSAPQTYEEFNSRGLDVFLSQNCSTDSRKKMHEALTGFPKSVIKNADGTPNGRRFDWATLLRYHDNSKLSLSLEGAGWKGTRYHEASCNSVLVMPDVPVKWTYPWTGGYNCIELPYIRDEEGVYHVDVVQSLEIIKIWLGKPKELYEMYCNGFYTAMKYRPENYYKNYIAPMIQKALL